MHLMLCVSTMTIHKLSFVGKERTVSNDDSDGVCIHRGKERSEKRSGLM